MNKYTHL